MKRILIVGVFDLFHIGHKNIFKRVKVDYHPCKVIAGVLSDSTTMKYKRIPICNEKSRYQTVSYCQYVDEVIEDFPLKVLKEQLELYNIDYVIRGKENSVSDFMFKYPKDIGILIEVPRTEGISTTKLISEGKYD